MIKFTFMNNLHITKKLTLLSEVEESLRDGVTTL